MQILIIEDEVRLAESISKWLKSENYSVDIAHDGKQGLLKMINKYDCIILDIMLPEISGLEVLKTLREKKNKTPVLMLTAKNTTEDKVQGLDLGADDYLAKPFDFEELLARIKSLIRRSTYSDVILQIDSLIINPQTKQVTRSWEDITLSSTEYRLLEYLMRHENHVLSETDLLEHVWDHNYDGFSNVVSVYMGYLRKKIDKKFPKEKPLLQTMRGLWYKITNN